MSERVTRQYCTFFAAGLCFGVPVERVQEVLRTQPMTTVPLAHPVVAGLINLRGRIVTAIDLRRRLALPARDPQCAPMNVVLVDEGTGGVSLLVDEIGDVIEVDPLQFETNPDTLGADVARLIRSVCKLEDSLMLALDVAAAIDVEDLEIEAA